MSGAMTQLPPGFVLDKPAQAPATAALPPGFVLDQPEPEKPGMLARAGTYVDNLVRQAAKGATFNFSDEIAAGAGAATGSGGTMGERYTANLAAERGRDKAFEAENPYAALAAQVAGGIANPVTRFPLTGGLLRRAMMAGGAGGALGAAAGFGEGEGNLANRGGAALTGGVTGAALGGAMPVVAEGASRLARKVAPYLGLNVPGTDAQRVILRDLERSGTSLDDVRGGLAGAGNQPMVMADVAGENVAGRAQQVARVPGQGRQMAADLVEGRGGLNQSARLEGEVKRAINAQDFTAEKGALLQSRATAAAPLYEEAFTKIIPTAPQAARVERFIKDPIGQEALQKGLRVIELEHLAAGTKFDPKAYGVVREGQLTAPTTSRPAVGMPGMMPSAPGARVADPAPKGSDTGKWVLEPDKVPNLRLMDAVKRGYDDIVEGFRNEYGVLKLDQYGRAVNNARAVYRNELADMFPVYSNALKAWAGPSAAIDAMELGRRVLTGDADQTAQVIAKMAPSEKDMFRIGVSRALIDRVKNTGDTRDLSAIQNIWGSQGTRERVAAAFDDPKEFERFSDFMKNELTMAKTNAMVNPRAGSQTTPLAQFAADGASAPPGTLFSAMLSAARGDMLGAGANVLRPYTRGEPDVSKLASEIAPYLFSMKAGDRSRLLDALQKRQLRDQSAQGMSRRLGDALLRGGTVGAVQLEN